MAVIDANYAIMAQGSQGLIDAWNRIESLLQSLDTACAQLGAMDSRVTHNYQLLKARWSTSAQDRQQVLRELARHVDEVSSTYQRMDAALAAQFG